MHSPPAAPPTAGGHHQDTEPPAAPARPIEAAVEATAGLLPELLQGEHEALQPGRVVTAAPVAAGRTTTGRWRCRVCQVECGGRDVFRAHCGSQQHFDGLQVFGLRPELFFAERLHVA